MQMIHTGMGMEHQLPYTDDELVAMSKESLKELKATAASVSIADAESRSAK